MNVVAEMLLSDPAPMMIWGLLMIVSLPALLLLGSPEAVRNPGQFLIESWSVLRRERCRRERERQEALHTVRYAAELTVAAERATEAAARWHEYWQETEFSADAAWRAWQDAEQQLTRSRAAAAFTMPAARTPGDYADRERFLHHTVAEAVSRGDLPATALGDALTGHGGWNPWLHPVDQELAVRRAAAAHRHGLYQAAVMAERCAGHDTRLAVSTRDSLRREAGVAVAQAVAVRNLIPVPRQSAAGRRPVFAQAV
jgi:hypothetical protein